MDNLHSIRVFRGDETEQVAIHVAGLSPPDPNLWYWEPAEYDGKVLYSKGYATREEAIYAAETSQVG
jgi:hypothetical protein